MSAAGPAFLGWAGILRLGLVQAALGAVVVLTTTTLNRVMVVELALPAVVPGLLVAAHYAVQMLRPRWGHHSDDAGRRTPWILGGMAALALGGTGAALGVAAMSTHPLLASASQPFPISWSAPGSGPPEPRC